MTSNLQNLRKQFANSGNYQNDNALYKFWDAQVGTTTKIRLLPDGTPNDAFWAVKPVIRIPFSSAIGEDGQDVQDKNGYGFTSVVPCIGRYEGHKSYDCPILKAIAPLWNTDKDLARQYYVKTSYILQGLVVQDSLGQLDTPPGPDENPIRRFIFGQTLFEKIKEIVENEEIDYMVTDYEHGRDLIINKTQRGSFSNYSSSIWSMTERPLDTAERAIVDNNPLYDLSKFVPRKPTDEELVIIEQLYHDSRDGKPYDVNKYGGKYKPYNVDYSGNGQATFNPAATSTQTQATPTVQAAALAAAQPTSVSTQEILDDIQR